VIKRVAVLLLASLLAQSVSAAAPPAPVRWYKGAKEWINDLWRNDADAWLDRIGPALHTGNYQGTIVMVSGTRMDTLAVFHAHEKGREQLRLVALSGPHRELIRDDKMVMVVGAGGKPVAYDADTAGRWNPAGDLTDVAKLGAYKSSLGGEARVAGRQVQIVDLQPRDGWRYGYRFWLDKETALPLRVALMDENGNSLEQMTFTDIRIGVKPSAADLRPSTRQGLQRIQTLDPGKEDDPGWRVHSPPEGFVLRATRRLGGSVQLLYSDGLASVSVYIEPVGARANDESGMVRGAVNGRSITIDGLRVVAIGKVPSATVERFARQVRAPAKRRENG